MERCFICGATEDKVMLFDAIGKNGIIKICKKCAFKEDIPIISSAIKKNYMKEKRQSVYDRLSEISGFKKEKLQREKEKSEELKKEEEIIKEVINKNVNSSNFKIFPRDLVRNFHWIIMRARRLKKLTIKQLAEKIKEPELALELLEKGKVMEGRPFLLDKIEKFLDIKIQKNSNVNVKKEVSFDEILNSNLTTSELKEMQDKLEKGQ